MGFDEKNLMALLDGFQSQSHRKMAFAQSRRTQEDDIFFVGQKENSKILARSRAT